jgi:transposase InsO family protein
MILTIVWNLNSFHVINVLSNWIKLNAEHYTTDVLIPLAEWRKTQIDRTDRKLIVHADNAPPHTAKMSLDFLEQNGIKKHLSHHTHLI